MIYQLKSGEYCFITKQAFANTQNDWKSQQTKFVHKLIFEKRLYHCSTTIYANIPLSRCFKLDYLINAFQKKGILPVGMLQTGRKNIFIDVIDSRPVFSMCGPVRFKNLKSVFPQKNIGGLHPFLHDDIKCRIRFRLKIRRHPDTILKTTRYIFFWAAGPLHHAI